MIRLGQLISMTLLLFAFPLSANTKNVNLVQEAQAFQQSNKVAIVVGVEKYDRRLTGFRHLDYAADDAVKMANVLSRSGYQVERLLDAQAGKNIILNRIKQKGKQINKDQGTLLFYFSGHGEASSGDNYLATYNALSHDLPSSGLGLSDVVKAIKATGVSRAVLFVDACRNDPKPGVKSGDTGFKNIDVGEGVQVFYSTRHGDVSYEHEDLEQGVFSHFLLKAFSGEAKQNGLITFNNVASYVEQEVARWTDRNMSQTQQPFRRSIGDYYGDFVLAGTGKTVSPPPEPIPEIHPQLTSATRPEPQPAQQPITPPIATRKSFEPEMVSIPAGSFTMGCVEGRDDVLEDGCYSDEKPAHKVTLSAFFIGKYEVTFDEWDTCEKAKVCPHAKDEGWGRGRRPVINVSWDDTQKYIKWLNQKTGKNYRLPTEAEWEYAARAGGDSAFPWGNSISCKNARYGYHAGGCDIAKTNIVGSYKANLFGLYDTVGNVWEWTQDWDGGYTSQSVVDPKGAIYGSNRVIRGGGWYDRGMLVRSAIRPSYVPDHDHYHIGLRLALSQ